MARVPASEELPFIVVEGTRQLGLNTPSGDPAGRQLFNELTRGGEAGARPGRDPVPTPTPEPRTPAEQTLETITVTSTRKKKKKGELSLFAALVALGRIDRIAATMATARTPIEKARVGQLLESLQPFELKRLQSVVRGQQAARDLAWLISNFPGAGGPPGSSPGGLLARLARGLFSIPALLATTTGRLVFEGFKLADKRATEIWTRLLQFPQPLPAPTPNPRALPRSPLTDPSVPLVQGPTVTAFRAPRPQPSPLPRVFEQPFGLPSPSPFASPFPDLLTQPMPRAQPQPRTEPQPRVQPLTYPLSNPLLTPFQAPGVRSRPFVDPFAAPQTQTKPLRQPNNCPPCPRTDERKKKPKKRKPRDVCYQGTYYERSNGITKYRRKRIPCQPSKSKSRLPPAATTPTSLRALLLNTAGGAIFSR
jgi:hypothetical protein